MFSLIPQVSHAAVTLEVVENYSSGIEGAYYTATLEDGTVLGFRTSYGYAYFWGAITQRTELSIPDSIHYYSNTYAVEYIGYNDTGFDKAQNLTSLTLPATVISIEYLPTTVKSLHTSSYISYVYSDRLSNLDKVFVPEETLTSYYENKSWSNYVLIKAEGSEATKITVNVSKPGTFAQTFLQQTNDWYSVNELTVVGELNTDDLNVFKRFRQLTKLDLSRAVITNIPDQFDGANNYYGNRDGFVLLEELSLPELNRIGRYAFAECYRLKTISMPKVKSIGDGAFAQLGASEISLPETVDSIGSYAFYNSSLESIKIPAGVTKINDYCFYSCDTLRSVEIPASVKEIGYESFRESGLTSLALPGVQTIKSYAFQDCKKLATVEFAEGLKSFEWNAFRGCTALTEIDLPSTLLSMYSGVFADCTNIKKVTSRAVVPPTHNGSGYSSILYGCDMTDVKLYVPAMSIDNYRAESGWKSFYTILPMQDKTSNAYFYDYATIDDASEFSDKLNMSLGWEEQNRNDTYQYYVGALDYNGSATLSMHDYKQLYDLGNVYRYSSSENQYAYNAHFTSLISNGSMRADNVQTTLKVNNASIWYFISVPYDVKVSDILYTEGTQFVIRKYSGSNRAQQAGDTWQNLTINDVMNAYEGYILRCNKDAAEFTFPAINNTNKNKVFEKESVAMPLAEYLSEFEHNRSWNLIGNPYPCYYDTRWMDFTAPITVWNRYYRRYDAYSPVDDSYILHPTQAFFVQRPIDQAAITFDKNGRQKDATVRELPAKAKTRAANTQRKVFNVIMSDGVAEDHTRFVLNDNASLAYELDKDASKFISEDNAAVLVYTVEDGVKYAINERPIENGTISLGFYAPADGDFTLSLNTAETSSLVLFDRETNTETSMSEEYHFTAKAGFHTGRFTIAINEATGIDSIQIDNSTIAGNAPCSVYTVDGQLVGTFDADNMGALPKGVYVVSSKDVKRIIEVK